MPRTKRPNNRAAVTAVDRHRLYEIAVQQPELMIGFIEHLSLEHRGPEPRMLREDFCGTAYLASMWVRSDRSRSAVAIDRDPAVIQYAEEHNRRPLGNAAGRLRLVEQDVLRCRVKTDVIVSLNFSHFIYQQRRQLLGYLQHARRCLRPGGLFICDAYGGPAAMVPCRERRKYGDFTYIWEQVSYDPATARVVNHIHFELPGRRRADRAFIYDWRLWTLAELREAMMEAGFDEPQLWFETNDGFQRDLDTRDVEAWVVYLATSHQQS